jgi:SHS2 domain-containing protein
MAYRFLEEVAVADIAFDVWSESIEGFFKDASDALANVMVEDISNIQNNFELKCELEDSSIEMLLFKVLQELIFLKDARTAICRFKNIRIENKSEINHFSGTLYGEQFDAARHNLLVDVKAVTFHKYHITNENGVWKARITLDI